MMRATTPAQRAQIHRRLVARSDAAFASPGFQSELADLRGRCRAAAAARGLSPRLTDHDFDDARDRDETGRDVVRNLYGAP